MSEAYVEANRRAIRVSSAFIPVIRMAILVGFLATFTVRDNHDAPLAEPLRGAVSFEGVSFRYATSDVGVGQVSLQVPAGNTLALVGATGSGKLTLIKLLLRFYDPSAGRVCIDGQPIDGVSLASLRGAIGLVSQDVYLFEGSVRDNIAYGRPETSEAEVIEAAKTAEAWAFIEALPGAMLFITAALLAAPFWTRLASSPRDRSERHVCERGVWNIRAAAA